MRLTLGLIIIVIFLLTACGSNIKDNAYGIMSQTGVYQGKAVKSISKTKWTFTTDEDYSEPLVTEDTAYFGSKQVMYAVETKTGKEKWRFPIKEYPSVPALVNNILCFTDSTGLYGIESGTGKLLWQSKYKEPISRAMMPLHTVASSRNVYTMQNGRMAALNIETGKQVWEIKGNFSATTLHAFDNDKIYYSAEGVVHVIDDQSGKQTNELILNGMASTLTIANNRIFISDFGGTITAYDIGSEKQLWQFTNDSLVAPNWPLLTVFNNTVLITDVKYGTIQGLDLKTGKEKWNTKIGKEDYLGVVQWTITAEDFIYVGAWDGEQDGQEGMPSYSSLICLDGSTGKELWKYKVEEWIMFPPAIMNKQVMIITGKNIVALK